MPETKGPQDHHCRNLGQHELAIRSGDQLVEGADANHRICHTRDGNHDKGDDCQSGKTCNNHGETVRANDAAQQNQRDHTTEPDRDKDQVQTHGRNGHGVT